MRTATISAMQMRLVGVGAILTLAVVLWWPQALSVYENVAFALAPSVERASAYGARHFSASNTRLYDIVRAEYFYRHAEALDAEYPYVNHQLARIEFLKGNFHTALSYINKEIELHGENEANAYYVRGLIEGYMGRYAEAAADYERFLQDRPRNWAALNDYAWVLLKAERFDDAARVTTRALELFPNNAWLLNSHAIALYELGDLSVALASARAAVDASDAVSEAEWLQAYPGNDPGVALQGISTLKNSALDNMHSIEAALAADAL